MGKLKDTVLILGEGPTEFYYFNSIRDVIKGLTIRPDYPKHTSIKELEENIERTAVSIKGLNFSRSQMPLKF